MYVCSLLYAGFVYAGGSVSLPADSGVSKLICPLQLACLSRPNYLHNPQISRASILNLDSTFSEYAHEWLLGPIQLIAEWPLINRSH